MGQKTRRLPDWYTKSPLREVIAAAYQAGVGHDELTETLSEIRFEEYSRQRVEATVQAALTQFHDRVELGGLSQPPEADESGRSLSGRYFAPSDMAYLSPRECARVFEAVFEQFGGRTVASSVEGVDLFWNRQYETVGIKFAPTSASSEISTESVRALKNREPRSDGRSPSTLAVVTNGRITADGKRAAREADIALFDGGYVARWLQLAQIPPAVYGPLLEEGENAEFEKAEVLERLAEVPYAVSDLDPFELSPQEDYTIEPHESGTIQVAVDRPAVPSQPGELGALYADPDDDGSYSGFDDLFMKLDQQSRGGNVQ